MPYLKNAIVSVHVSPLSGYVINLLSVKTSAMLKCRYFRKFIIYRPVF
jgi:hypothetical protein